MILTETSIWLLKNHRDILKFVLFTSVAKDKKIYFIAAFGNPLESMIQTYGTYVRRMYAFLSLTAELNNDFERRYSSS